MNENNFSFIIELGTSKIRGAAFNSSLDNKSVNIEKDNNILLNSNIQNFTETNKLIKSFLKELEKESGTYINSVNLMIDSTEMKSINFSISKNMDGKEINKRDIIFLVRDAKQQVVKNQPDAMIAHIIIVKFIVDNKVYDNHPIDIICDKLSVELNFIYFPKNLVRNLENIFHKNTINVDRILCSSYVRSLNIIEKNNHNSKICVADVGFEKTTIYQFSNKNLVSIKILEIGNHYITKDISKIFSLSIEESENIKKNFDFQKNINENNIIPQEFFKTTPFKDISTKLLNDVIFSRVDEIINLIFDYIVKINNFYKKDLKIYFIGNGSKILLDNFTMKNYLPEVESIEFIDESVLEICKSGSKVIDGHYKSEAIAIPKIPKKTGFFEKLFHLFE